MLLSRPGDNTTAATQAIEILRNAWAGKFAEMTQGVGGINGVPASVSVVIDSPADNATIIGPDVTVTGAVINTSGAETGVTVNGMPAAVTGSRFVINHVPLQSGANTISVTATDANGLTATTTKSVSAQAGNYIRITSNIESGVGPLDVSLRLNGSFSITNPTITTSGPVAFTLTAGANAGEYTVKLSAEGTYTINASAVGPDSQTYTDTITITVLSRQALEKLLIAKWNVMKQKIVAGDNAGAASVFHDASRDMFLSIFNDPSSEILSRLNEISDVEIYSVLGDIAQGGAIRQEDDGIYAYPVNFTRDESGLWSIYGF